jgi:hypothetical protein
VRPATEEHDHKNLLERWEAECSARSRFHHERTARDLGVRSSKVALWATICASVATVPAVAVALSNTISAANGSWALLFQWIVAVFALGTAILNAAQSVPWANPKRAEDHRSAGAEYEGVAQEIGIALGSWENMSSDERTRDLQSLRVRMGTVREKAPTLPQRYINELPS